MHPVSDDPALSPTEEQNLRDAVMADGHETPFSYQTVCRLLATLDRERARLIPEDAVLATEGGLAAALEEYGDVIDPAHGAAYLFASLRSGGS